MAELFVLHLTDREVCPLLYTVPLIDCDRQHTHIHTPCMLTAPAHFKSIYNPWYFSSDPPPPPHHYLPPSLCTLLIFSLCMESIFWWGSWNVLADWQRGRLGFTPGPGEQEKGKKEGRSNGGKATENQVREGQEGAIRSCKNWRASPLVNDLLIFSLGENSISDL